MTFEWLDNQKMVFMFQLFLFLFTNNSTFYSSQKPKKKPSKLFKLRKTVKKKGFWPLQEQPKRHCFHPGASSFGNENDLGNVDAPEVTAGQMLRAMMAYIWPKDDAMIRKR